MMSLRKPLFAALAAGALTLVAPTLATTPAHAAPPTVEIVAMAHWPVQKALQPLRDLLAKYDGQVRVVEMDAEAADGEKRLKSVGLKGHIPIVVLIDGKNRFTRADGKQVEFVNFPAAAGNPMGLNGSWTAADVEAALAERLRTP